MLTLIIFLIILGSIVFFHELGHFIFAKKAGIYVYEFSLGFGPKLFSFKRKNDETEYMIKAIPLGGYVAMAGEEDLEEDDKLKIPDDKKLYNKSWIQRLFVMIAGVMNNFILGFILLFIIGLCNGSVFNTNEIDNIMKDYPLYNAGVRDKDKIIEVNHKKVKNYDDIQTELAIVKPNSKVNFKIEKTDGKTKDISIKPKYSKKDKTYYYGISIKSYEEKGIVSALKYAGYKFKSIYKSMIIVIECLFTGKVGLNSLSGPVGIYSVVGSAKASIIALLYLTAYLSINVGFINLIPFPAFDGGRVLFLIIEKIKGSKINPKIENTINSIGFMLLMLLMVIITVKDVLNLF